MDAELRAKLSDPGIRAKLQGLLGQGENADLLGDMLSGAGIDLDATIERGEARRSGNQPQPQDELPYDGPVIEEVFE